MRIEIEKIVSHRAVPARPRRRAARRQDADDVEAAALVQSIKETAKRLIALVPELPREAAALLDSVNDPSQVADLVISNLDIEAGEKQEVLAANNVRERLRKVLMLLTRQLEILKVRERINSQVQEEMGHSQREYVLRQQLKAIKGELGEMDDESGDAEEFQKKITEAKMPEEAEKVARKQLDRLKSMQPSAPSTPSRAPTSSGSPTSRGRSPPRTCSTSASSATCSTRTTTTSRRSRSASSSTWRCSS
jgi:ATP-dependent Lon protease